MVDQREAMRPVGGNDVLRLPDEQTERMTTPPGLTAHATSCASATSGSARIFARIRS